MVAASAHPGIAEPLQQAHRWESFGHRMEPLLGDGAATSPGRMRQAEAEPSRWPEVRARRQVQGAAVATGSTGVAVAWTGLAPSGTRCHRSSWWCACDPSAPDSVKRRRQRRLGRQADRAGPRFDSRTPRLNQPRA